MPSTALSRPPKRCLPSVIARDAPSDACKDYDGHRFPEYLAASEPRTGREKAVHEVLSRGGTIPTTPRVAASSLPLADSGFLILLEELDIFLERAIDVCVPSS